MEIYKRVIEIIDANLIFCLPSMILTLILVKAFFKNRFETRKALAVICWIIIVYVVITWTFYMLAIALNPEEYAFLNRATGPYAVSYWMMFLSALIFPFTLFIKKWASKFWYVLFVSFAIKIGMYLERFIIIVTSFHRDYYPSTNNTTGVIDVFSFAIGTIFLQGMILAILILVIFEMLKKVKNN